MPNNPDEKVTRRDPSPCDHSSDAAIQLSLLLDRAFVVELRGILPMMESERFLSIQRHGGKYPCQ